MDVESFRQQAYNTYFVNFHTGIVMLQCVYELRKTA
jgi:hypothetical protein